MNNVEPSLDDLTIFLAVCKAGGFRAAAKQLGLSASHVSETLTRMEVQLGVPLLSRTTRSVMPDELLQHACIRMRFSSGALSPWTFERDGEVLTVDAPSRLTVGVQAAEAAVAYACAGHGLVCTLDHWLAPHLQTGKLIPVLEDWWHQIDGPWMYFPNRLTPAPLRAFVDLIASKRQSGGDGQPLLR